jgi:hypothetical protein
MEKDFKDKTEIEEIQQKSLSILSSAIDNYCDDHDYTKGTHFSQVLSIKGSSNFTNRLNPYEHTKRLSFYESIHIMIELGEYSYPLIRYYANMFGLELTKKLDYKDKSVQNFKDILIEQGIQQGLLFELINNSMQDDVVDKGEWTLISGQLELLRRNINSLENIVRGKLEA